MFYHVQDYTDLKGGGGGLCRRILAGKHNTCRHAFYNDLIILMKLKHNTQ
jgi:hypothetical protein